LMQMFFRQRTQEFLHIAKNNTTSNTELKKRMADFTKEMKEYMTVNGLTNDPLMKNLCDDMVIVYRTLGTQYGFMYSCARQTSQGNERLFNVCDTPTRFCHENNDMNTHETSDDSPYYTQEVAAVMRDVSHTPTISMPELEELDQLRDNIQFTQVTRSSSISHGYGF